MIRALAAYDGTEFCGFQRQRGDRTVQGELEAALARLWGQPVTVRGAGRTDAGVHARGQVIAFRSGSIPPERMGLAVNRWLPGDVAVRHCAVVPDTFDPRRDATARVYSYTLALDREREPLRDRFATRVEPWLDLAAMRAAAAGLVGEHDFAQFACQGGHTGSTRRCLRRAEWTVEGELVRLWFEADSFLYHQVRLMVSALLEIGRGRFGSGLIADMLAGRPRPPQVAVVPPMGLMLEQVRYDRQEETA